MSKLCYNCGMVVYPEKQRECPNCGRITDWNRYMKKPDSSKQSMIYKGAEKDNV